MLMTHLTKITLFGAVALLAAVGCQREQVVVANNPTYDAVKGEVTTQFVFNVSTASDGPTKQTAANVQATPTEEFRGMTDVHILAYDLDYGDVDGTNEIGAFLYDITQTSSKATRDYDLGSMLVKNEISSTQSSRVIELSLPLETNAILAYGKAPRTGTKDAQGSVIAQMITGTSAAATSLSNVTFQLENRLTDVDAFDQYADLEGHILTAIIRSGASNETIARGYIQPRDNRYWFWWPQDATSKTWDDKDGEGNPLVNGNSTYHAGYTFYRGEKLWKEYGDQYDSDKSVMKPLEELLGNAYSNITTLVGQGTPKEELRAAASPAVLRLASDLYQVLSQVLHANPTSVEEMIAQKVAQNILDRAKLFFKLDGSAMAYDSFDNIKTSVVNNMIGISGSQTVDEVFNTKYPKVTDAFFYRGASQPGFPSNLGLPIGAAIMSFTTTSSGDLNHHVVSVLKEIPAYGVGGGTHSVKNYVYPAELMYWTNSPIRVSDESVDKGLYPKTVASWDTDSNWATATWTKFGTVKSTTRSVAVLKEMNYGTALLKTTVQYGASIIHDNNKGIHPSEEYLPIDVSSGNKFKVTGILIGGVSDIVGWDFLPKAGSNGLSFNKMVYDNLGGPDGAFYIPHTGAASPVSQPVYTLTWDNCNTNYLTTTPMGQQDKVYVALELVNETGKDIWGELNLIRNGGTFYLVGELDPNTAAAQTRLKKDSGNNVDLSRSNFFYPPFDVNNNGSTIDAVRVFMQDYVTEVNLTFGDKALRHAYLTMPDLRASNISLGLSVDISWQEGLIFNGISLGGE